MVMNYIAISIVLKGSQFDSHIKTKTEVLREVRWSDSSHVDGLESSFQVQAQLCSWVMTEGRIDCCAKHPNCYCQRRG